MKQDGSSATSVAAADRAGAVTESGRRAVAVASWLQGLFEASSDLAPDAVALECGSQTLRYTELDQRANRLAHRLIELGLSTGGRVGILLERSVDTYDAGRGADPARLA